MKHPRTTRLVAILAAVFPLVAQPVVSRPKVLGVAHMAVYVKDLAKARQFYEEFLGYGEPFTLPKPGGAGVRIAFVKINDSQYLELFTDPDRGEGQLNHISFYTDNADRMFTYLKSSGVAVMGNAGKVGKGQTGNKNFNVKDPDGNIVEIVEYQPDSWTSRERGKFMPPGRIAERIMHVGVLCGELEDSQRFYVNVLGFREFWRGSGSPRMLSWVNMRVPDGQDYLELMLYDKLPAAGDRGGKNHVSLMVPDAEAALAVLKRRSAAGLYTAADGKEMKINIGVNRKRQINLYDPDGTRIELMEPDTIDGKAAADSTAPVPHPKR